MDDFEKHIRDNKALFDEHKADREKMWGAITKELGKSGPKMVPIWRSPLMKIAASIVLVMGIASILIFGFFEPSSEAETIYASKELLEIDMHYRNMVSYQVQLLQNSSKLSDGDKKEFLSFMDELDEEYEQLRLEMNKNLDNELVLEAIISNYKKRIELIENLLKQINDSKLRDIDDGYTL